MIWQPIETAPKDGTIVTLFRPHPKVGCVQTRVNAKWSKQYKAWVWPDGRFVDIEFTKEKWLRDGNFFRSRDGFTHWMPYPSAPSALARMEVKHD